MNWLPIVLGGLAFAWLYARLWRTRGWADDLFKDIRAEIERPLREEIIRLTAERDAAEIALHDARNETVHLSEYLP